MATAINAISYGSSIQADAQTATGSSGASLAPDKETFLQLLVAQIKNQNPLNPSDGTEFVTQLAQFSQLEQTMSMQKDVAAIRAAINPDSGQTGSATSPATGEQVKGAQ